MELVDWCIREIEGAIRFFRSLSQGEVAFFFLPVVLFDLPRAILFSVVSLLDEFVLRSRSIHPEFVRRLRTSRAPLVSLIVPALNEQETLEKTIASLFAQDYPNKQIIVVDDGSTDDTIGVCRRLIRRHGSRLKFGCLRPRQGKSAAINFGCRLTQGEFVVTVDADGTYDRDAISRAMRPFADPRVAAVSGNVRVRNARNCLLTRMQAIEYCLSINLARRFLARSGTLILSSGAFAIFRKSALQGVGGFSVGPGEDRETTVRLHKAGYRIGFTADAGSSAY